MINIWEEGFSPPLWDRPYIQNRRLITEPEVVAALVTAFNSDQQTSGRLTNLRFEPPPEQMAHLFLFATWAPAGTPVVVKLNAAPWELYWMMAIDRHSPGLVPRVFASGEHIGLYAVRWLVLERIPHPLSHAWDERLYDLLARAAVRFQTAARVLDQRYVSLVSYQATFDSINRGLRAGCPGPVQGVLDRFNEDWTWVSEQCGYEVCFGDLTMGNALSNNLPPDDESIFLIDPLPRIAPWAWDAAYCQTLDANSDVRMIHHMAEARRAQGLPVSEPPVLDRLATILLAWLSAHRWWSVPFRQEDPEWRTQIEQYIEYAASR